MSIENARQDLRLVRKEFKGSRFSTRLMRTGLWFMRRYFSNVVNLGCGTVQEAGVKVESAWVHMGSSGRATQEGFAVFMDTVDQGRIDESIKTAGVYALRLLHGEADNTGASLEITSCIIGKLAAMRDCLQQAQDRSNAVINRIDQSYTALDSITDGPLATALESLENYRRAQ